MHPSPRKATRTYLLLQQKLCIHMAQIPVCRVQHRQPHLKGVILPSPPSPTMQNKLRKRNNESDCMKRNVKNAVKMRRERRGKYHPAVVTRGDTQSNSEPSALRQGVMFSSIGVLLPCKRDAAPGPRSRAQQSSLPPLSPALTFTNEGEEGNPNQRWLICDN